MTAAGTGLISPSRPESKINSENGSGGIYSPVLLRMLCVVYLKHAEKHIIKHSRGFTWGCTGGFAPVTAQETRTLGAAQRSMNPLSPHSFTFIIKYQWAFSYKAWKNVVSASIVYLPEEMCPPLCCPLQTMNVRQENSGVTYIWSRWSRPWDSYIWVNWAQTSYFYSSTSFFFTLYHPPETQA